MWNYVNESCNTYLKHSEKDRIIHPGQMNFYLWCRHLDALSYYTSIVVIGTQTCASALCLHVQVANQGTDGPVNAHLFFEPAIGTKHTKPGQVAKYDLAVK